MSGQCFLSSLFWSMVMLVIFMMMGALLMGNLVQGYLEERLPPKGAIRVCICFFGMLGCKIWLFLVLDYILFFSSCSCSSSCCCCWWWWWWCWCWWWWCWGRGSIPVQQCAGRWKWFARQRVGMDALRNCTCGAATPEYIFIGYVCRINTYLYFRMHMSICQKPW